MYEYTTMIDWLVNGGVCEGIIAENEKGTHYIYAKNTVIATGGIGGKYKHSTNYPHLTGDSISLAKKYSVRLQNLDYIQIHPTTLYSARPGRRFLISESVRGEGALLYNKHKERFVDELKPRMWWLRLFSGRWRKTVQTMYGFLWSEYQRKQF